jgi:hypothetical protein
MALEDYSVGALFRGAFDYAETLSRVTAFPTFHQCRGPDGVTRYDMVLLNGLGANWEPVPESALGGLSGEDVFTRFQAAFDYAKHRAVGALPNFHHFDYQDGRGTVHGTILLDRSIAQWQDLSHHELGDFAYDNAAARFRAAHEYSQSQSAVFLSAFPNFHNFDHGDGRGMLYGTILLSPAAGELRQVRHEVMRAFWGFRYESPDRGVQQSLKAAQRVAAERMLECEGLAPTTINNLRRLYERDVRHVPGHADLPVALLRYEPPSNPNDPPEIQFFDKWQEIDATRQAAALAHMMVHLAGGTHGFNPESPGYATSEPVKAERCISAEDLGLKCTSPQVGGQWTVKYNP